MQDFFKFLLASCLGTSIALILSMFVFFAMVGGLAGGLSSGLSSSEPVSVKSNSVLEINFNTPVPERTNNTIPEGFSFETNDIVGLSDMVRAIEHAKTDDDIKGIFLDVSGVPSGMVTRSTIRDALVDFKESGKFIVAFSKFYSQNGYYMASVADEIIVHPIGGIDFRGFGAQIPFFKNALDKVGVKMEVYYAGQFKSATEPFRLTEMSEQNRKQTREYLEPLYNMFTADIAKSRGIEQAEVKRIANEWLLREAEDAITFKFADKVGYRDEVLDIMRERIGLEEEDPIPKVGITAYAKKVVPRDGFNSKDQIAVIYAEGDIIMGKDTPGQISDDDYTKMIRKIRQNDKVKGIVLRVNSPGGSALTSESIWRELSVAKEDGIPIVVSMGDYAASGGYYIACMADKILAEPNTITGSIGIFSMIPNASELLNDKLGVSLDTLNIAKYATSINGFHNHSSGEAAIIQQMTDNGYEMFLKRVSEGRGMTRDAVHEIAQGRVWTGEKASQIGLVDELGGLEDAIKIAEELTDLSDYALVEYPEVKDPFTKMLEQFIKPTQMKTATKAEILESELGELSPYYSNLKAMIEMKGPQARLPFLIDIQ